MSQRWLAGYVRSGLIVAIAALVIVGCVTSPEVKMASSQMTQAIAEYEQNIVRFQDNWIAEIDKTLDDLGKALVMRAVKMRIDTIAMHSDNFSNDHWNKQFRQMGMIPLSEEIESTQEAARNYVQKLMKYKLDQAAMEAGIKKANKTFVDDAMAGLQLLKDKISEEEFNATREMLESQKTMASDSTIESYGQQILEWRALKQDIPGNLKNLENVIHALKTTHHTVDAWVQTDVKVSGKEVGDLVVKHADMLGF